MLVRMPKRLTKPKFSQFEKSPRGILAYNIRSLRFERNLTQEDVADLSGLDRGYISALERCVWNITLSNIEKLAEAFDVEPWQLLYPPR